MKKKVILIGEIIGSYRTQYILEYLSQRNDDFSFIRLGNWGYTRVKNKWLNRYNYYVFDKILSLLILFFLPSATHVFMLPMNREFGWIYKLAHRLGKRTITDFYMSWVVKTENPAINENPISKKYMKKLHEFDINMIKYADNLIFLNESEAMFYLQKLNLSHRSIRYHISPIATPARPQAILPGFRRLNPFFTLCWWGKAAKLHGLDLLFGAILLLKNSNIQFQVVMFEMDQSRASMLEKQVVEFNLQDVVSVRYDLTFSSGLEEYLVNQCDISLGAFGTTGQAETVLMNKVADSMSMGIPMVTRQTKAIDEFGLGKEILFLCEPDPIIICQNIISLIENGFEIDDYQQKTIDTHKRLFSQNRFFQDLDKIFENSLH